MKSNGISTFSIQILSWLEKPDPVEKLNHGSAEAWNDEIQAWPASPEALSASHVPSTSPVLKAPVMPVSTAMRASRLSSSSGRNRSTSTPATIFAIARSEMPGNACLANPKKSR